MKTVQADDFEFWFEGALDTFTFDEKDTEEPIFHVDTHEGRRYRGRTQRDRHLQQTEESSWSVVLQGGQLQAVGEPPEAQIQGSFFYWHAEQKVDAPAGQSDGSWLQRREPWQVQKLSEVAG